MRIDLGKLPVQSADELKEVLRWLLAEIAQQYGVELADSGLITIVFADLVQKLSSQGQVAILIDEYDKPLIDNIDDIVVAREIQAVLKSFYSVIKSLDAHLRFVLLTGISKFSRVGIFSGLNNLRDISLERSFSTLLGVTETEIESDLQGYFERFAKESGQTNAEGQAELRHWYNGFCFSADCQRVYNPFSLFSALVTAQIGSYWFETGTPTFLMKLLKQQAIAPPDLENLSLSSFAFSTYDIENLALVPILYQTGYLTVHDYNPTNQRYTLGFPNYEVEQAFNTYLLDALTALSLPETDNALFQLTSALYSADIPTFFDILNRFFADVPYDIQLKREKYYQSVFYLIFKLIGLQIEVEQRTNRGRIDAVIVTPDVIYIFEFKLDGSADDALVQIKERGYAEKYRGQEKPIYLLGVNFSTKQRKIEDWQPKRIAPN